MNRTGLAFALSRLTDCPDLPALKRVWEGLGVEYQNHPQVRQHKDRLKAAMQAPADGGQQ